MLKIEKGIFCTARPESIAVKVAPANSVVNMISITKVPMLAGRKRVHRHRRRVAGEHEAEPDLDPGKGGAQDPEPGQRRERRLRRLQDDPGGDRPGRQLAEFVEELARSSRRPGCRAGRGRRSAGRRRRPRPRSAPRGATARATAQREKSRTSSRRTPPPTSTLPSSERPHDEHRALALVDRHRPAEPVADDDRRRAGRLVLGDPGLFDEAARPHRPGGLVDPGPDVGGLRSRPAGPRPAPRRASRARPGRARRPTRARPAT